MNLVGCGILKKELGFLIEKNNLQLHTDFLDQMMHVEMKRIASELPQKLKEHEGEPIVVFYGCCHPLMDKIVDGAHACRMDGVNCFEMLLGKELYEKELTNGAYFLLESMAYQWDEAMQKTFGGNKEVEKAVFHGSSKYILMIKTPLSSDFKKEAKRVANDVGLPLREIAVGLENLEMLLMEAVDRCR